MYDQELKALQKANRYRQRVVWDEKLQDFASNDYLGLASSKKSLKKATKKLLSYKDISPKASMLVNGYHPIHQKFEKTLAKANGFEDAILVGSGFLANISLIESLVRKKDMLFIDSEYHASGVLATHLIDDRVVVFEHNNPQDLQHKLQTTSYKRAIIAIEGVYSMSGAMCDREMFDIADSYNALLIVDEAHSAGVVGDKLLGVYDYYDIGIKPNHIKMGTLGKAYGSYGAYILASKEIVAFLQNRAKPIIYSTAPSLIDVSLALVNFKHINKNLYKYHKKKSKILSIIKQELYIDTQSLIIPIQMRDNQSALSMQQRLLKSGYLVGAIRQPTVQKPILRVIPNLSHKPKELKKLLYLIKYAKIEQKF